MCFVLGVCWVQNLAFLPEKKLQLFLLAGIFFLLSVIPFIKHRLKKHASVAQYIWRLFFILCALILGLLWAAWRAELRLAEQLDLALENESINVIGVVSSMPTRMDHGIRFRFYIESFSPIKETQKLKESVETQKKFPRSVLLSWYSQEKMPSTSMTPSIYPGERWQWTVRLKRPHGYANPKGFDYEAWLLGQGIRATGYIVQTSAKKLAGQSMTVQTLIENFRLSLRQRIQSILPQAPYTGTLIALVIGDQSSIPSETWRLFSRMGISHLMAISGLHITMIGAFFAAIAKFLWRHSLGTRRLLPFSSLPLVIPAQKVGIWIGALSALAYALLSGFGIPAQRTICSLFIVGWNVLYRQHQPLNVIISRALAVVVMIDPWSVLAPGFWLSFMAVGIIFYVISQHKEQKETVDAEAAQEEFQKKPEKPLQKSLDTRFKSKKMLTHFFTRYKQILQQTLKQASLIQIALTAGMLPLTLFLFGQFSLISPITNAIAIPLVSFVITPLALLGAFSPEGSAHLLLTWSHALLDVLMNALLWLDQLSWASMHKAIPPLWTLLLALTGLAFFKTNQHEIYFQKFSARSLRLLRYASLTLCLPAFLWKEDPPKLGEFRLNALDIGQGSAVLIETNTHRLLYDTGPRYSDHLTANAGHAVILPYLYAHGISALDRIMISHKDNDHSGGLLSIIKAIPVNDVYSPLPLTETQNKMMEGESSNHHSSLIANHKLTHDLPSYFECQEGQVWTWDKVQFEVLYPNAQDLSAAFNSNNTSCVLRVSNGQHSALLTGDIEKNAEAILSQRLQASKLQADILFVPHHGSKTSSTENFIEAIAPHHAVFQMGYKNRFGHPHPQILDRYTSTGKINIWRNDTHGAIRLSTYKESLDIHAQRIAQKRYWMGQ